MEALLLEYDDGVDRVIRSLEYYLAGYEYKESSRKLIESCLTFLRNNAHLMEYKRCIAGRICSLPRQRLANRQRPGGRGV